MADKNIGSLPKATSLDRDSLLVMERQGEAMSLDLGQLQDFAKEGVDQYVTDAQTAANEAKDAATEATEAVGKIGTAVEDTQAAQTAAENAAQRAEDALANMGTAAEDAEKSAQAAAQSEVNAKASEESVAANKTAAEDAQKAAETARDESVAASNATEQNATTAVTAAKNAGDSATLAGNAAADAEAARAAIENMMVEAITVTTGNPATVSKELVDGVVKLVFGLPQGEQGEQGTPGSSIQSIDRTSGNGAPGTTDTYTITLTTGETFDFYVYNGADGIGSGDMSKSVYDPQGKATDIFKYVDDAVGNVKVTTDATPTEGSTNPVQSGGVYETLKTAGAQSDWNQNDETSADYVKNRTHYIERGEVVCVEEQTVTLSADDVNSNQYQISLVGDFSGGAISNCLYHITLNETEYECVGRVGGMFGYIGNMYLEDVNTYSDTGEPFLIKIYLPQPTDVMFCYEWDGVDEESVYGDYTIKVVKSEETVYQLDEKFIPDTIARSADLAEKQDKLSGTQGQFVGFDAEKNPVPVNVTADDVAFSDNETFQDKYDSGELTGKPGDPGVGIESVKQTTTSTEDGGENIITVTKTDGSTSTFSVKNGSKGSDGAAGKDGNDGPAGAAATINGVTTLVIEADAPITTRMEGNTLYIGLSSDLPSAAEAYTVTLLANGWTEGADGRYEQTVAAEGVTTDPAQVIQVDVSLTGEDTAADAEAQAAWGPDDGTGPSSNNIKQGDGTLTFYCTAVPTVNIPVNVGVH